MNLSNYEIMSFSDLLFKLKLKGKSSRMRTRLLKTINEYWENVYKIEHAEIIKAYSKKDENGELILNEEKTGALLIEELIPEFNEEYQILQNESFIIDETESNKEMLLTVARSLLECDLEISGEQAILYDEWCEKFEEVIERYSQVV